MVASPSGPFSALFDRLVDLRKYFHTHPELSFQETSTQQTLKTFLVDEAQIPERDIHVAAGTGLVVNIFGPIAPDQPTPAIQCVAFRGDMDALPMTEENTHLPYKSTRAGAAHMCGHDGHMASLAGFAVLMQRSRARLPANTCVRLLFQPAEEGHFGAVAMIKDKCLDGVDEVYGYHNFGFAEGVVAVKAGAVMSHGMTFTITLKGPGGHGSAPHQTQDPIVAAGHVIVAMQTIMSRNVSAHESAIISIAQVHGGEADNVIPSTVTMSGTCRDFNPAVSAILRDRMTSIVVNTAKAYGVEGFMEFEERYPATVNSPAQSEIVRSVAVRVAGDVNVTADGLPLCASEDFSFYLHERPGCFFFLGTQQSQGGQNRTLHSSTFDFNDAILPLAVRMFLELAQHRFGCDLYSVDELAQIYTKQ
ncbi:Aste57867_23382 [Aphanomyces stellatus]|uniref:Aste57867_23382 protein n=1 Tax=Aphanomyces stellatus TaxID=120398 RepID=A0A485LS52_9STRA|nr:hypothetical protein As57867_023311 [Aphanomyces stellatus]VFU00028.1 Aste57867_23382 [Aphanomyces stellatus]